jgi:hypothetical protein
MISTFTAFFDANVFYGNRLRCLMIWQAQTKLFRARWSADIHREWIENVVETQGIEVEKLKKTRVLMDAAVLDCVVTGYESLIPTLKLPDENDRHVLAAAITARASVIVTFNLRDFPTETLAPHGLDAVHPDAFLLDLDSIDSGYFFEAVREDLRRFRKHTAGTVDDYIQELRTAQVPQTANHLAERKVLLEEDE